MATRGQLIITPLVFLISLLSSPTVLSDSFQTKCRLAADSGPCRGSLRRWFYTANADQCRVFSFGGCRGNANNFGSKLACESFCKTNAEDQEAGDDRIDSNNNNALVSLASSAAFAGRTRKLPNSVGQLRGIAAGGGDDSDLQSEEEQPLQGGLEQPQDDNLGEENWLEAYDYYSYDDNKTHPKSTVLRPVTRPPEISTTQSTERRKPKTDEFYKVCGLRPEKGTCYGVIKRWYFDCQTGRCEEFYYTGCSGNLNNFKTPDDCYETCGGRPPSSQIIDEEEKQEGLDNVSHFNGPERWSIDQQPGQLPRRMPVDAYGRNRPDLDPEMNIPQPRTPTAGNSRQIPGQEANRAPIIRPGSDQQLPNHNFDEKRNQRTGSRPGIGGRSMPSDENDQNSATTTTGSGDDDGAAMTAPSQADDEPEPKPKRLKTQTTTVKLSQLPMSGSRSRSRRQSTTLCRQPPIPGPCKQQFKLYYYDDKENECREFAWSGCGGNENKFNTLADCQYECMHPQDKMMMEEPDGGVSILSSVRADYGIGNYGQDKNLTLSDEHNSNKSIPLNCNQMPTRGFCKSSTGRKAPPHHKAVRWYYDKNRHKCRRMIYYGCGGNRNNFKSFNECKEMCQLQTESRDKKNAESTTMKPKRAEQTTDEVTTTRQIDFRKNIKTTRRTTKRMEITKQSTNTKLDPVRKVSIEAKDEDELVMTTPLTSSTHIVVTSTWTERLLMAEDPDELTLKPDTTETASESTSTLKNLERPGDLHRARFDHEEDDYYSTYSSKLIFEDRDDESSSLLPETTTSRRKKMASKATSTLKNLEKPGDLHRAMFDHDEEDGLSTYSSMLVFDDGETEEPMRQERPIVKIKKGKNKKQREREYSQDYRKESEENRRFNHRKKPGRGNKKEAARNNNDYRFWDKDWADDLDLNKPLEDEHNNKSLKRISSEKKGRSSSDQNMMKQQQETTETTSQLNEESTTEFDEKPKKEDQPKDKDDEKREERKTKREKKDLTLDPELKRRKKRSAENINQKRKSYDEDFEEPDTPPPTTEETPMTTTATTTKKSITELVNNSLTRKTLGKVKSSTGLKLIER